MGAQEQRELDIYSNKTLWTWVGMITLLLASYGLLYGGWKLGEWLFKAVWS